MVCEKQNPSSGKRYRPLWIDMQAAQSRVSVKHSSFDFGGSNPSLSTNSDK